MEQKRKNYIILGFLVLLPLFAFAQSGPSNVQELLNLLFNIVGAITAVVVAAALLFFFWGLAKFILAAGNQVDKEKGKDLMIWGIIALFVMVSIWGIVLFLQNTFLGTSTSALPIGDIFINTSN